MADLMQPLDGVLRDALAEAERRYRQTRSPDDKTAYRRALRAFSDFVIRGKRPSASAKD